jgi:peptidoglycan hydrolase-like protein with peptidoglycan-binding domain
MRYIRMRKRSFLAVLALVGSVLADENVREVQTKLHDAGFYLGEIDGAYSSQLTAALSRYQIRNGLPITGQLDAETSKALRAKPAVTNTAADPAQSSETWRQLRKRDKQFLAKTNARAATSPSANETPESNTETSPRSAPAATVRTSSEVTESASGQPTTGSEGTRPVSAPPATGQISSDTTKPASAPLATGPHTNSSEPDFSAERVRDYVAAFVLAGLDRQVGAEVDFFADRADYYDSGMMSREKIRQDLQRYGERWPERQFWVAGNISVEPQSKNRVRVTFPLEFKLRNGTETTSGKVDKSLVLEAAGDDLRIVAVSERKAE